MSRRFGAYHEKVRQLTRNGFSLYGNKQWDIYTMCTCAVDFGYYRIQCWLFDWLVPLPGELTSPFIGYVRHDFTVRPQGKGSPKQKWNNFIAPTCVSQSLGLRKRCFTRSRWTQKIAHTRYLSQLRLQIIFDLRLVLSFFCLSYSFFFVYR